MNIKNEKTGYAAIIVVSILAVLGVVFLDPIVQDLKYHAFKDQRTLFGIPNFWNVISNAPFLIVGYMGIYSLFLAHKVKFLTEMKAVYALFFIGIFAVAIGSSYYHLWPGNDTLLWDRLPMTVAFMSLFSIIIGEFVSLRFGRLLVWPFVILGAWSVIYWHASELAGEGDLRPYILVQFLPILVIPLMLVFFKNRFTNVSGYWYLLLAYVMAKALEYFDAQVYGALVFISGHSVKHIVAAIGVYLLLLSFEKRERR